MPTPWVLFLVLAIGLSTVGVIRSCGMIEADNGDGVTIVHTGVSNE